MDDDKITYYSKLVSELVKGAETGGFSGDYIPDSFKWEHLVALFYLSKVSEEGKKMYTAIYNMVIASSEKRIRKKAEQDKKIKMMFQSYSAAQWPAVDVYNEFAENERIETGLLVSPVLGRGDGHWEDTYSQTLKWFKENDYRIYEGVNNDGSFPGFEDFGGVPDIVFITSSWYTELPYYQQFISLPLNSLVVYIPYGLYLANSMDGEYADNKVYNKDTINLMWRVYCDCSKNLEGYKKYQYLSGKNVRFSGFAKMDYFYEKRNWNDDQIRKIWKIPDNIAVKSVKKVIVAPHYSVIDKGVILFSTFRRNLWFFLYLAQKYKDEVSFVFKPHPLLRTASVKAGLFNSYEEYDEYIEKWEGMSNARVIQDASYLDLFDTSDAMIMDSGSFLGEYLYTGKPLLYLTRPEQAFLPIGEKVVDVYYKTPGENYLEIEEFLQNVVISGNDYMKEKREKVFKEEYDYKSINGIGASEYICNDVYELINA
ncbi:CDP-glycerol glycerophosphotransferase family protein [Butyrivibrio sp. MC2021]|uniref:CDP-glycerol glycerophosphotransferase family protein n=1 Tax=Butyrivibrio sp. MC2021 TaxID=1408306 RepID=UPI000478A91E|nr:CDP-glycerol glycerophosphotransferase family protein [Butyrivibrio sp. MC2021]